MLKMIVLVMIVVVIYMGIKAFGKAVEARRQQAAAAAEDLHLTGPND